MSELEPVRQAEPISLQSFSVATWVNCNHMLQAALQQLDKQDRGRLVLRCDDLPAVYGVAADLQRLFNNLLCLMLALQNDSAKLYLHIHCVRDETSLAHPVGTGLFRLQFVSHLAPVSARWETLQPLLSDSGAILLPLGGKLTPNTEGQGGCLFSVFLPGKSL